MPNVDIQIKERLDRLVPRYDERVGDWEAIARGAAGVPRRRSRPWARRLAVVGVAAAALLALVLAAPWERDEGGTVLERALAAVGDGPVIHVVFREGWAGPLVELSTGREVELRPEREFWYDPKRGLHETSRLNGVVQSDVLFPPERAAKYVEAQTVAALALDYRRALEEESARVLGPDVVDGIPVYWIRVDTEMLRDVADGRLHEWAQDIAVSRETYEPLFARRTRDANPDPDGVRRIVTLQTLPEGAGDFTVRTPERRSGGAMRLGPGRPITLGAAATAMGVPALWAGHEVDDVPLAHVYRMDFAWGYTPELGRWPNEATGLRLEYGTSDNEIQPGDSVAHVSLEKPYALVTQTPPELRDVHQPGTGSYVPPNGFLVVQGDSAGYARVGDVDVRILASSRKLLLAVARALEPIPAD